jgi:hypothetical protein
MIASLKYYQFVMSSSFHDFEIDGAFGCCSGILKTQYKHVTVIADVESSICCLVMLIEKMDCLACHLTYCLHKLYIT